MASPEWARALNTTIADYVREREVNTMRNRKLLSLLESKGRVTFGHSGNEQVWRVQYKQNSLDGYADMDTITFSRLDQWKQASLPWRGYVSANAISKKEQLMNKGKEAIIKLYSELPELMMDDIEQKFGEELYQDGTVSGTKRLHGIESFMATTGVISTNNLTDMPSQTFAGLSTVLGNYGGTWSGTWPDGKGDPEYDFWSPIIVNYTGTGWTAATKTWPNTCLESLRYGILKSQRSKAKKGMLELVLLADDLYRPFLDKLATSERILVERGTKQSPLIALGYNDVVNYDGCDVTWEYGIPASVGYGFNTNMMELQSLQDRLFVVTGPVYDEETMTWRLSIDFFGNAKWNPRHFCKWTAAA